MENEITLAGEGGISSSSDHRTQNRKLSGAHDRQGQEEGDR